MDISLQKRINHKTVYDRRKEMIASENLHIQDMITYDRFKILHQKYAPELSEREFARYFLDIDYILYYKLQSGDRESTTILEMEYYEEEEFDELEKTLLEECTFDLNSSINYDTLTFLWNSYGNRFTLKMFAEEIFGLSDKRVDDLKFKSSSTTNIVKDTNKISRLVIRKLREKVISECNFHRSDRLTLEQFYELYNTYKIEGLDEETFALKILGVPRDNFKRFKRGKRSDIAIFYSSYPISPDYICELREKVILEEKLRITTIKKERFWELYNKYGGMLSAEVFAEEVLDASWQTIKASERRNHDISILGKIEISDEYIAELRQRVINENKISYNELMTIRQMRALYYRMTLESMACFLMGEKQFIVRVLNVPSYCYDNLNLGERYKCYVLVDSGDIDLQEIRQRVIKENKLHYDDAIGYKEFHKLHQKYAKTVREYIFAREVLDIDQRALDNIRHDKNNKKTHILLEEPLPSEEELQKIKTKVIEKYKLHRNDSITYKQFLKMYRKYGGIMPEDMFADRILDISALSLGKIRRIEIPKTRCLIRTFMSVDEINALRDIILEKHRLFPGGQISVKDFNSIYMNYNHTLPKLFFARNIIGLNTTKKILDEEESELKITIPIAKSLSGELSQEDIDVIKEFLIQGISIEKIALSLRTTQDRLNAKIKSLYEAGSLNESDIVNQRVVRLYKEGISPVKISHKLNLELNDVKSIINELFDTNTKYFPKKVSERKAERIIEEFLYTEENVELIKIYISQYRSEYIETGIIPKSKLEFLAECVEFAQCGIEEIEFASRGYSLFGEYDKACRVILENINNDGIGKEDKEKLREMEKMLKYAIKQQKAVDMLRRGESVQKVIEDTGLSEIKVLRFSKMIKEEKQGDAVSNEKINPFLDEPM